MIIRRVGGALVVDQADSVILCSPQLLIEADREFIQQHNNVVTFTASNGVWCYEIARYDYDRSAYEMRRID